MENLAKGFAYPITMGWAGTEVLMMASQGVAWPLAIAFLIFAIGFVVVGCYPLEDSTVEKAGIKKRRSGSSDPYKCIGE